MKNLNQVVACVFAFLAFPPPSAFGQVVNSKEFIALKELVARDILEMQIEAGASTLEKCEEFVDLIPDSKVKQHCGRLAVNGIGWWEFYEPSKGLYREVQEVHEKYELARMEELGIALDKNLVEKTEVEKAICIKADKEARDLERIFLASVASNDFPELDLPIWQTYSPGTLLRFELQNEMRFNKEISVFELLRLLEFAKKKDLGSGYQKRAIARFLFDKFASLEGLEQLAHFVSFDLINVLLEDQSYESIIAAENLCIRFRDHVSELLSPDVLGNQSVREFLFGKLESEPGILRIDVKIRGQLGVEVVINDKGVSYVGDDRQLQGLLEADIRQLRNRND